MKRRDFVKTGTAMLATTALPGSLFSAAPPAVRVAAGPGPGGEPRLAPRFGDARDWWFQRRFGMFLHWGLYSLAARHEWVKKYERRTDAQYQPYFERFEPDLYDPRTRAALLSGRATTPAQYAELRRRLAEYRASVHSEFESADLMVEGSTGPGRRAFAPRGALTWVNAPSQDAPSRMLGSNTRGACRHMVMPRVAGPEPRSTP